MSRAKRYMLELLVGLALIYPCFVGLLVFQQRALLYFPNSTPSASDLERLAAFQKIEIKTADGLTLSSHFRAPVGNKPTLLSFHGNASHPAWNATKFQQLIDAGYGVLLGSYRGYAGNPGEPTEEGLRQDALAYVAWLDGQKDYVNSPRVYYGESLGSGVAVDLAQQKPPAALILEAPFLSALDAAKRHYPFIPMAELLMWDQYRSDLKIQTINAPKLFLLAQQDEVVSFASGEKLAQLAYEPKQVEIFPRATHSTLYENGAAKPVADFLERTFP